MCASAPGRPLSLHVMAAVVVLNVSIVNKNYLPMVVFLASAVALNTDRSLEPLCHMGIDLASQVMR